MLSIKNYQSFDVHVGHERGGGLSVLYRRCIQHSHIDLPIFELLLQAQDPIAEIKSYRSPQYYESKVQIQPK